MKDLRVVTKADGRPSDLLPVVLAPGLLCDARLWDGLRPLLPRMSLDVDFREDASLDAMADRILKAPVHRFILVGFSMGGMAAVLAASRAPRRIAALVVLSAHGAVDDADRRQNRLAQIRRASEEPFEAMAAALPSLYFSDPMALRAAAGQVEAMALGHGPEVFKRHVRALLERPDIGAAARLVTAPTKVLNGADDAIAPPALGSDLASRTPHADFAVIADCGHMTPLESPEIIARAITAFILAEL